jgi:hypothetical protein
VLASGGMAESRDSAIPKKTETFCHRLIARNRGRLPVRWPARSPWEPFVLGVETQKAPAAQIVGRGYLMGGRRWANRAVVTGSTEGQSLPSIPYSTERGPIAEEGGSDQNVGIPDGS